MLFQENGKVQQVKFIDFQQICSGSPVLDLSYSLYAGGTKEIFDNLDFYLRIYHDTLSDTLKQFDIDVNKIYSFENLQEEWRKFCKFGFVMASIIWRVKFKDDETPLKYIENVDPNEILDPIPIRKDKEEDYKRIIRDLVTHMYENDFF